MHRLRSWYRCRGLRAARGAAGTSRQGRWCGTRPERQAHHNLPHGQGWSHNDFQGYKWCIISSKGTQVTHPSFLLNQIMPEDLAMHDHATGVTEWTNRGCESVMILWCKLLSIVKTFVNNIFSFRFILTASVSLVIQLCFSSMGLHRLCRHSLSSGVDF